MSLCIFSKNSFIKKWNWKRERRNFYYPVFHFFQYWIKLSLDSSKNSLPLYFIFLLFFFYFFFSFTLLLHFFSFSVSFFLSFKLPPFISYLSLFYLSKLTILSFTIFTFFFPFFLSLRFFILFSFGLTTLSFFLTLSHTNTHKA